MNPAKQQGSGVGSDQIEHVSIDTLLPYARNSRKHPETQVSQIAASIDEFGFVGSIIIRDGVIAKGHGTLAACRKLYAAGSRIYPAPGRKCGAAAYPEKTVPVSDVSGWSDAQFRAYVIADNQIALNADWDVAILETELNTIMEQCAISDADLRHMFSNMQAAIESSIEQQESPEKRTPVEAMELRPHEHYDFIVVLARDAMTWNNLCAELGITARPLFGRKNTKYGISRAITAEKVLERIQNNHSEPKSTESNSA